MYLLWRIFVCLIIILNMESICTFINNYEYLVYLRLRVFVWGFGFGVWIFFFDCGVFVEVGYFFGLVILFFGVKK